MPRYRLLKRCEVFLRSGTSEHGVSVEAHTKHDLLILISSSLRRSLPMPCPTNTRLLGIVSDSGLSILLDDRCHGKHGTDADILSMRTHLMTACTTGESLALPTNSSIPMKRARKPLCCMAGGCMTCPRDCSLLFRSNWGLSFGVVCSPGQGWLVWGWRSLFHEVLQRAMNRWPPFFAVGLGRKRLSESWNR